MLILIKLQKTALWDSLSRPLLMFAVRTLQQENKETTISEHCQKEKIVAKCSLKLPKSFTVVFTQHL